MAESQEAWIEMRTAKVPHPGQWAKASGDAAVESLQKARRVLVEIIDAHFKRNQLGFGSAVSQAELESICNPLPPVPEGYRLIVREGLDEAVLKDHTCTDLIQASATLIIEKWWKGEPVEIEPVPICPDLCYWVAQVQTANGLKLMVLVTDQALGISLASPGSVTIWAHGQEQTLVLPVAPARLDPGDDRLGYVIAFCRHHNLILPAFRPPESKKAWGDAE
jgi:hypothetical protein